MVLSILQKAKETLLAKGWLKYAMSNYEGKCCLLGSLFAQFPEGADRHSWGKHVQSHPDLSEAVDALAAHLPEDLAERAPYHNLSSPLWSLIAFNDGYVTDTPFVSDSVPEHVSKLIESTLASLSPVEPNEPKEQS